MSSKEVQINFRQATKHIFLRPGQIVDIAVDTVRVRVEGAENPPFHNEVPQYPTEKPPDLHVHLRPGEAYRTKREDGTMLHVLAEGTSPRLQLALDILSERKNMLTLDYQEYDLLGPDHWTAVGVAAQPFVSQVDLAIAVAKEEIDRLAATAIKKASR
jgi:hypothetical protein